MKQHITIEQLNELSDKGKERLREWQIDNEWDIKGKLDPIPNIGQMIELLDEFSRVNRIIKFDKYYEVGDWGGDDIEWRLGDPKESIELRDALWEVVKEVLEHD